MFRAQMFAAVVNEQLEDGYLSWMNRVKLDEEEEFDQDRARDEQEARARAASSQALRCCWACWACMLFVAPQELERALSEQPLSLEKLAHAITRARPFRLIPEVLQLVEEAEGALVPLVRHALADTEDESLLVQAIGAAEGMPAAPTEASSAVMTMKNCMPSVRSKAGDALA